MVDDVNKEFPLIPLATHPDTLDAFMQWPMVSAITGLSVLDRTTDWEQLLLTVSLPRMLEVAVGLHYEPNVSLYYRRMHPLYGKSQEDYFECEVWLFDTPTPNRLEQQPYVPMAQIGVCAFHQAPEPTLWVNQPTSITISHEVFPLRRCGAFFNEHAYFCNPSLNEKWSAYVKRDLCFLESLLRRLQQRWTLYAWSVAQAALAHHSCPVMGSTWLTSPVLAPERRLFFQSCVTHLRKIRPQMDGCDPVAFDRLIALLKTTENVD